MSDEEILNLEEMAPEEIDAMARRMGHVAQEDFKGDPEKWIDAKTFVERAANELPIARGVIRGLNRKLEKLETRIAKQSETFEQFNKYHQTAIQKTEEEAYQRGLEEAKERLKTAVEEGDVAGAEAAWADAEELRKKKEAAEEKPEKKEDDQEAKQRAVTEAREAWEGKNPWFKENRKMAKFAYECGQFLAGTKPNQTAAEQLEEITEMVKEEFPDYFLNPNRKRPGATDSGGKAAGPGGGRKKGYNDLPAEAQRLYDGLKDEFKARGKDYPIDEYLAHYHGPWR